MPTTHPSAPSVRPLRAGEVEPLIEVFDGLSAQSRFLRFNALLPRLTTLMVEQLTAQEEGRHEAFVASVDGMAVGIGRWVRYAAHPQRADVAVEVVDAYHRRGIGRALMQAVTESAALAGVEFLFFCVRRDNDPARKPLAEAGVLTNVDDPEQLWIPVSRLLARLRTREPADGTLTRAG